MVNVQFSDDEEKEIVSVFGAAQDSDHYAYSGVVESDDARLQAFYQSIPREMVPADQEV